MDRQTNNFKGAIMNTIKIHNTNWVLPIIYSTKQIVVHLNPRKGLSELDSKWSYCLTLYTEKTPAIIRLSNLKHAKQCARNFTNYLTINAINANDLNSQNLIQLLKFKDFVTSFTIEHNIQCYIKD
jgi:hypothetical protein